MDTSQAKCWTTTTINQYDFVNQEIALVPSCLATRAVLVNKEECSTLVEAQPKPKKGIPIYL